MTGTIAPQTAFIPLEIVPDPGLVPSSPPVDDGFKVGIPISLDDGATYKLYEFDTGGGGFQAAYNPSWWSSDTTPIDNGTTFATQYKSGIIDNSQMVAVPITFETLAGSAIIPTATYDVAQIISVSDTNAASTFPATWTSDVAAGTPAPLYGNFWGDFGASLENTDTQYLPGGNGFLSVLPQLPGNLSNGFIVALGPEPETGQTSQGYLQVGLTQADIDSFPIQIKMGGTTGTYPNSGMPTYSGSLSDATVTITDPNNLANSDTANVPLIWDTGTPTIEMYPGLNLPYAGLQSLLADPASTTGGAIASGDSITLTSTIQPSGLQSILDMVVDATSGGNAVNVANPQNTLGDGSLNTGLQPFFDWDVMFDVAQGIIGLRPHEALACFAAGTRIGTEHGAVPVEELYVGQRVVTLLGAQTRPIEWFGRRRVNCRAHPNPRQVWPIRVLANAFADGVPSRNLWLSPDHAVHARGVLIPVKYLVNDTSVAQVPVDTIVYYHIELSSHDVILAEVLPCESYLDVDGRRDFANGALATRLFPDFSIRVWEAEGCAPLAMAGPHVSAVRAMLERRASGLMGRERFPGASAVRRRR